MKLLNTDIKNKVLQSMMNIIENERPTILKANQKDLDAFGNGDQALYDRLVVDDSKIDDMITAIKQVKSQEDPVGQSISDLTLDSGLRITNKTAPFGTIMIIYESRPDVTIEAAVLAFKANNKILLKGGKEALNSNLILEKCWHDALEENGLSKDWIKLLHLQREETQEFLRNPTEKIDLIVPRGGERLIKFVKDHATCAVLISGRGNNFLYVAADADWEKTVKVIVNAKTDKISGCNALDKVLIDKNVPDYESKLKDLQTVLKNLNVELIVDAKVGSILTDEVRIENEETWYEEFLAMKLLIAETEDEDTAIDRINKYSGGHSSSILTENKKLAKKLLPTLIWQP